MSDERDLKSHQIMELTRAIERVRAAPLGDFTTAQAVKLAAIEATPDAEESLREQVARAMWETHGRPSWWWDKDDAPIDFNGYRSYADAAIAVMRGDS